MRRPGQDPIAALESVLRVEGPVAAGALAQRLGVSRATLSRRLGQVAGLVTQGRARATQYAVRRAIEGVATPTTVYAIDEGGTPRPLGQLDPVHPGGFHWSGEGAPFFADLPWFLHDLRPRGFLGRLVPRRYPDVYGPDDVRLWSGAHVLRYLGRHGWDLPGQLVVGDAALDAWARSLSRPAAVTPRERYPEIARDVLEHGTPGSSAAGEQPKFLVRRAGDGQPVLVKLSPPLAEGGPLARRVADLLVAEHLALETWARHGQPAARTTVHEVGGRVFLEVERFDRAGPSGRHGAFSLEALDAEFAARSSGWVAQTRDLVALGLVPPAAAPVVQRLAWYGALIANSDMHAGNLSFLADGLAAGLPAPAYDMLPMAYAPQAHQLLPVRFEPRPPLPGAAGEGFPEARAAAEDFWRAVARDPRVSADFRDVAARNADVVAAHGRFDAWVR